MVVLAYRGARGQTNQSALLAAHRQEASSTNPETWANYEVAVRACKEHGYGGIGFVFSPEDDLCGVDLDLCLDPETGEIEGWAQAVIEELDSYTEISPSGTGVHVLVRATLPEGTKPQGTLRGIRPRAVLHRHRRALGRHAADHRGPSGSATERRKSRVRRGKRKRPHEARSGC